MARDNVANPPPHLTIRIRVKPHVLPTLRLRLKRSTSLARCRAERRPRVCPWPRSWYVSASVIGPRDSDAKSNLATRLFFHEILRKQLGKLIVEFCALFIVGKPPTIGVQGVKCGGKRVCRSHVALCTCVQPRARHSQRHGVGAARFRHRRSLQPP